MLHVSLPARRSGQRLAAATHLAMSPAAYLRLRRLAAGLTVAQVAERLRTDARDRANLALLIRMLETPGSRAKHRPTIEALRGAFTLDVDVYFQLATETVGRHPRVCQGCGCSEWDPCTHGGDGYDACAWAGQAICTACVAIDPTLAADLDA